MVKGLQQKTIQFRTAGHTLGAVGAAAVEEVDVPVDGGAGGEGAVRAVRAERVHRLEVLVERVPGGERRRGALEAEDGRRAPEGWPKGRAEQCKPLECLANGSVGTKPNFQIVHPREFNAA